MWCIPCTFFIIACVLNLIGCVWSMELANTVKPALLPLLSATTLACLLGQDIEDYRPAGLLVAAQLMGFAGDTFLLSSRFGFFIGGIVAFLIGHVFYMILIGGRSWKGLTLGQWAISVAVMVAVLLGLVRAIGIEGPMFWPMLVYGFALMLLIFSALAGVMRVPRGKRGTWWILLAGALLFAVSDSCLALGTFGVMTFALRDFLVMSTYLLAQSLLAMGGVRLILGNYSYICKTRAEG